MSLTDNKPGIKNRGCTFLAVIVVCCFIGTGVFYYVAGLFVGTVYRNVLFFALLFGGGLVYFIKEIFYGKHW